MSTAATVDDFKARVAQIESSPGYRRPLGFGLCRVARGRVQPKKILTCVFPVVNWNDNFGSAAVLMAAAGLTETPPPDVEAVVTPDPGMLAAVVEDFSPYHAEASGDRHRNVQAFLHLQRRVQEGRADLTDYRIVFVFENAPPQTVPGAYLRLCALSQGKAPLRSLKLDGIFGLLDNLAWAGGQPYELDDLRQNEIALKLDGAWPMIDFVDKFPRYLMHVIPADNTRILDGSKVRLGAQLAPGTTVMPGASYINFNSGTLGPSMVEGRISSQAVVGAGSDVGGGASILGVLSGGNATPISVGEKCLLGANSVTGIPLGDGCVIDAGVTVLAGTRLFMDGAALDQLAALNSGLGLKDRAVAFRAESGFYEFKASALAGAHGMHIRTDSATGRMVVKRSTKEVTLNADLHRAKTASSPG